MTSFIGVDPGGTKSFGWCLIEFNESSDQLLNWKSGTCSSIQETLASIMAITTRQPKAIGIDAPLYWTRAGDRQSDLSIRKAVSGKGGHSSTVNHVNSLRGACLVQGILTVVAFSEVWPDIMVTESHPKALLIVSPEIKNYISNFKFSNEHERDAFMAALSARSYYMGEAGWENYIQHENDIFIPSQSKVAYWFPKT